MSTIEIEPKIKHNEWSKIKHNEWSATVFGIGIFAIFFFALSLVLYFAKFVSLGVALGGVVISLVVIFSLILYLSGWAYALLFTRSNPFSKEWALELRAKRAIGLSRAKSHSWYKNFLDADAQKKDIKFLVELRAELSKEKSKKTKSRSRQEYEENLLALE